MTGNPRPLLVCVTGASLPISVSFAHLLLAFEKVLCDTFQLLWSTQDWFLCFAQKQSLTTTALAHKENIFLPKELAVLLAGCSTCTVICQRAEGVLDMQVSSGIT